VPNIAIVYIITSKIIWSKAMARKKPEKEVERELFTFSEAQEFLRISHQTLYKLMKEGLPSHKLGNKRVFLKEDLLKWVREH
jgi:excisionase family DNA binding protein